MRLEWQVAGGVRFRILGVGDHGLSESGFLVSMVVVEVSWPRALSGVCVGVPLGAFCRGRIETAGAVSPPPKGEEEATLLPATASAVASEVLL